MRVSIEFECSPEELAILKDVSIERILNTAECIRGDVQAREVWMHTKDMAQSIEGDIPMITPLARKMWFAAARLTLTKGIS